MYVDKEKLSDAPQLPVNCIISFCSVVNVATTPLILPSEIIFLAKSKYILEL